MDTVYKSEQIAIISNRLNISKTSVENVINEYIGYLKQKIDSGNTVKFLNICFIQVEGNCDRKLETLAYISYELGQKLKLGREVVWRILTSFEEMIITDIKKFYSYNIRGLLNITVIEDYKERLKVRITKSTIYNNKPVRIFTLGTFKRKIEV